MTKSKSVSEREHFKMRMQERYGLEISKETYNLFIAAINTGTRQKVVINGHTVNVVASYRAKQSARVSLWVLILGGVEEHIPVCFDNVRNELITTHPNLLD